MPKPKWSYYEIELLKKWYKVIPVSILAGLLGKSKWSIYDMAKRLGLTSNRNKGNKPRYIKIRHKP